jgi:hypothetical protein
MGASRRFVTVQGTPELCPAAIVADDQPRPVEVERMRALVERPGLKDFGFEEIGDILDAIGTSGPRYGAQP